MLDVYSTILVPVDGSEQSERAFKKALAIAKRNSAKLVLVHMVDPAFVQELDHIGGRYHDQLMTNSMSRGKKLLDELEQIAEIDGHRDITKVIRQGVPKIEIAKEIPTEFNIDLIVMGATGRNAVEKFLVGSTSEYVLRHASCDVLIVRDRPTN